jgi:hypothetical protein
MKTKRIIIRRHHDKGKNLSMPCDEIIMTWESAEKRTFSAPPTLEVSIIPAATGPLELP